MKELTQADIQAVSGAAYGKDFRSVLDAAWWGGVLTAFFGPGAISMSIGNALYPAIHNAEVRGIVGGATLAGGMAFAYLAANTLDSYFFPKSETTVIAV